MMLIVTRKHGPCTGRRPHRGQDCEYVAPGEDIVLARSERSANA